MSKKRIVTLIVLGIAIVAVPFLLRFLDRKQAEDYINRIGVQRMRRMKKAKPAVVKRRLPRNFQKVQSVSLRLRALTSDTRFLRVQVSNS